MSTSLLISLSMLLTLVIAGLYKPWWVLWWMARQNRKKVLLIYGTPLILSWMLYLIFSV